MKHDGVVAVPAGGCFLSFTPPLPSPPVSLAFSSDVLATATQDESLSPADPWEL